MFVDNVKGVVSRRFEKRVNGENTPTGMVDMRVSSWTRMDERGHVRKHRVDMYDALLHAAYSKRCAFSEQNSFTKTYNAIVLSLFSLPHSPTRSLP